MSRKRKNQSTGVRIWNVAAYCRLSREDGDKIESNSIAGQRSLLTDYIDKDPGLHLAAVYQDDGFTGTNFDRPDFQRMIRDVEAGSIDCIIVKDLSRFGRDYITTGHYLERWLPAHGVRFIAVGDSIDSAAGSYDLLLPFKNVFNEQYARDISAKVRGAVRAKQERGQFIGAFASYGYRKSASDHNRLEIDPVAAQVVRRVFSLFESGVGKVRIAKTLNAEGIPCPSEYKRLSGDRYRNSTRCDQTTYWTYSTIHRMLQNRIYAGDMEQGRSPRAGMHGRAKKLDQSQWVVVPDTHEAIIPREQFDRVQQLLKQNTWQPDFQRNVSPFAGFLKCGDCGRALCKVTRAGGTYYGCGSYKRYGPAVCSPHSISHRDLEQIVLEDLNRVIASVRDLKALAEEAAPPPAQRDYTAERERLRGGLDRLYRLKKSAYEDYRDGLISREDFLRYREDYETREGQLTAQLEILEQEPEDSLLDRPWVSSLLRHGKLTELDRTTLAETVQEILVFEDRHIEITYRFADDLALFHEPVIRNCEEINCAKPAQDLSS